MCNNGDVSLSNIHTIVRYGGSRALETYYTYSADTLKAEIKAGKYALLRHFMFGSMGDHFEVG